MTRKRLVKLLMGRYQYDWDFSNMIANVAIRDHRTYASVWREANMLSELMEQMREGVNYKEVEGME